MTSDEKIKRIEDMIARGEDPTEDDEVFEDLMDIIKRCIATAEGRGLA